MRLMISQTQQSRATGILVLNFEKVNYTVVSVTLQPSIQYGLLDRDMWRCCTIGWEGLERHVTILECYQENCCAAYVWA